MKMSYPNQSMAWEAFRFAIVGPLLASPPEPGELQQTFRVLSEQIYQHPLKPQKKITLSRSTIERWYYKAKSAQNPIDALKRNHRADLGKSRVCGSQLHQILLQQYEQYPFWSKQLHYDNLKAIAEKDSSIQLPSYSSINRYMKSQGWDKKQRAKKMTLGAIQARQRLEQREVRSYEIDYVNGLWHLDFHHSSVQIINTKGEWKTPKLLSIIDDHSRLICHLQFFWEEDTRSLVHGFIQALQKRGLPRSLMTDNGAAMTSAAFTQGLHDLSIVHETTLPYSPYQNGKQEIFWGQIEGRFMAMLAGQQDLTLSLLNDYCQIWVEREYHRTKHRELNNTPMQVFLQGQDVSRNCPETCTLKSAFTEPTKRRQRKNDGTISINQQRYEIPNAYRHFDEIYLRYAPWDMTTLTMVDPITNHKICRLKPWNKSESASGQRRQLLSNTNTTSNHSQPTNRALPHVLQRLVDEHHQSDRPLGYLQMQEEFEK